MYLNHISIEIVMLCVLFVLASSVRRTGYAYPVYLEQFWSYNVQRTIYNVRRTMYYYIVYCKYGAQFNSTNIRSLLYSAKSLYTRIYKRFLIVYNVYSVTFSVSTPPIYWKIYIYIYRYRRWYYIMLYNVI